MSLVIDTLRSSTLTEELSDDEVQIIEGLFELQEYQSGEAIVQAGDARPDKLYVLAHGDIEVKIKSVINTHPTIVYRVMRGVVRNTHSIARRENSHSTELRNYIYRNNGRY